jgi:uncharacterized membrane protein HdeD (DUF308 family)
MFELIKKNPIADIIIGSVLIILGVFFVIISPSTGESIKDFAIGLLILLAVILLVYPSFKKRESKLIVALHALELVIGVLVSAMFLFDGGGNPSLWIGLVIYVHGVVGLIGGYFSSKKQKMWLFFLSLLFITIGVYIFASKLITDDMLINVLLVMFLAPGIFFLIFGLTGLNKKPKTKKSKAK